MDHRKILKEYMRAVFRAEGVTFADFLPHDALTLEEAEELRVVASEVESEAP